MQQRQWKFARVSALSLAVSAAGCLASAQTPVFTSGNLVVATEGCGVQTGFCAGVANSNATTGSGYGDNQAAPVTLLQFTPSGTSSLTYVNSVVLPQAGFGANLPVSGEYGSSSEGLLQLSGNGQYLTFAGYGLGAAAFNASPATYGAMNTAAGKYNAFAQTDSLTGQSGITPVARVVALIDPYGNVNSSSAFLNIFNLNNPRSAFTATGASVYLSGQGNSGDTTGGVFYSTLFNTNTAPTAITGTDTASSGTPANQDTRDVQIYNNTLYVSLDSTQGSGNNRSYLGSMGTPPPTSLYNSNGGPTQVVFYNNASTPTKVTSTGKLVLTASEANGLNASGQTINLSANGYFFANSTTLYIADTGEGKQSSASTTLGNGGLQKWIYNSSLPGWQLVYTLSAGLNLVANATNTPANTTGTTGLYAVAGSVSGNTVSLYVTNSAIGDLDPTYIYGFTDTLSSTTKPTASFVQLAQAPAGSNFKGIAFAPLLATGSTSSVTLSTVPSGLTITSAGTGCVAGTYTAPVTLDWTSGSSCSLSVGVSQSSNAETVTFTNWQDGTTSTTYNVTAPSAPAVYRANFSAGAVNGLVLTGLADRTEPGVPQTVTVMAVDSAGNPSPGFTGAVAFSSTDQAATLPATYTFQAADAGVHAFPVTFNSGGHVNAAAAGYTLTATSGSLTASESSILILNDVWALNRNDATNRLTGTGVATAIAGGTSGTSTAGGIAFDNAGNAWVTLFDTNGFAKYTAITTAGGTTIATATSGSNTGGLNGPAAVIIDGSGNAWFANQGNGSVSVIGSTGTAVSPSTGYQAGNLSTPSSVTIDSAGTVWLTNHGSSTLTKIFGAATPVVTPLAAATSNGTLGVAP